jgi:hypothetical protein
MTTTTIHATRQQWPFGQRVAARLGVAGAALGAIAGAVELTVGSSIPSWIGDKHDTTRLGIVTLVLAGIAIGSGLTLARRHDDDARRLLLAAGLVVPGLVGYTTVGRLWYVPGALLIAGGLAAVRGLRRDARSIVHAIARQWTRGLVAALGVVYAALGLTAHGPATIDGIGGGLLVIAIALLLPRLPAALAVTGLVASVLPFAIVTWWSLATPVIAVLVITIGGAASFSHHISLAWTAPRIGAQVEQSRDTPRRMNAALGDPCHVPRRL